MFMTNGKGANCGGVTCNGTATDGGIGIKLGAGNMTCLDDRVSIAFTGGGFGAEFLEAT